MMVLHNYFYTLCSDGGIPMHNMLCVHECGRGIQIKSDIEHYILGPIYVDTISYIRRGKVGKVVPSDWKSLIQKEIKSLTLVRRVLE